MVLGAVRSVDGRVCVGLREGLILWLSGGVIEVVASFYV